MAYIHEPKLKYPDKESGHMFIAEKVHDYTYDANFNYRLKGFKYGFIKFWLKVLMIILVKPLAAIRYALIIKGKKNIKKYKKMAHSKAMISVANHTAEWDTLFVLNTRYFKVAEFPIWIEGAESKAGMMYRMAGGIPLPRFSLKGTACSFKAMREVIDEGKWLHVYPEAACWYFYPAVREFQIGAFKLAYETHMPVLPMAVTYRKPKGIYKLFKKHPNAKIEIGEPQEADYSLPKKEAAEDLSNRCRKEIMRLMGINSEEENQRIKDQFEYYKYTGK